MPSSNDSPSSKPASVTVTLNRGKECKGSVRFETDNNLAPLTNVYLSRTVPFAQTAKTIRVTVEIVD